MILIENERNIWETSVQEGINFKIKFGHKFINVSRYENIHFQARRLIFKENDRKLQFTVHNDLITRTVKRLILAKLEIEGAWIKFMLNEKMYNDKSRISEIPISIEVIGMIIFQIEEKTIVFGYSNNSFSMIFSNERGFDDAELEVRCKVGIGEDV
jgi:hypothetical protein